MNSIKFILAGFVAFQGSSLLPQTAFADDEGDAASAAECNDTSIDYANDATLTKAERIAAMDRALNGALNKYDSCLTEDESASSESGSSGSGSGDGGGEGEGGGSGVTSSTAASDIAGNEAVPVAPTTESLNESEDVIPSRQGQKQSNGKLPEDIPSADNDSILEAQIRQAAINESDPIKKERLWNEYRKYKGLPSK